MHSARQIKRLVFVRLYLPLLLSVVSLHALVSSQTQNSAAIPAYATKLIEIKVTGSKRFTQEEIAAASGLLIGTTASDDVFRKASRQLGESGAFGDISYSFTYSGVGTKLTFQVTDADKFVPGHFADFVWFSDQDLLQKLRERVPLFHGELPTSGRLPDQVSDVLQAMLVENGIPGHVEYLRSNDKAGKLQSFDYTVANIVIRIHKIEFPGAGSSELPELQAAAQKLNDRDYYRALLHDFIDHSVLPVYHEHGFLRATCGTPQPKVVKANSPDTIDDRSPITFVDVIISVTPGDQYKLGGWNWSGNKNLSTDQLEPLMHGKPGQTANTVQLGADLREVQQLYATHGYVTSTIKADAQYDEAAGTVSYTLSVTEGDLYHMGELSFRGIDNNLTARLRAIWKLRTGDVYDANYLKEFLPQARKLLPPNMDWDVASHVTAMTRDKTVDVDLQYTAKAPQ